MMIDPEKACSGHFVEETINAYPFPRFKDPAGNIVPIIGTA